MRLLFAEEVKSGWLTIAEVTQTLDISEIFNMCIRVAKQRGCKQVMKLESDAVWYDAGAAKAIRVALQDTNPDVRCQGFQHSFTYQNSSWTTLDNVNSIVDHNNGQGPVRWYSRKGRSPM